MVAGSAENSLRHQPGCMRKLFLLVALVLIVLLFAGVLSLALWEPEAPRQPMEKVVPNERLQG
ncbi:MAG TPA: hypothetical protein VED46_03700 [Alphaproteobacteria bacterium]|jgi:hypothetical protein|nr:hypothetical protein [Alphaproteobacteria bacterium]